MTEQQYDANVLYEQTPLGDALPPQDPIVPQTSVAKPPKAVRRVGTFTLGITLILAGVFVCAMLVQPADILWNVLRFSPLILVALGVEVLVGSACNKTMKYDLLSMFLCAVVVGCAILAACVPVYMAYYGPQRSEQLNAVRMDYEQELYDQLHQIADINEVSVNVHVQNGYNVYKHSLGDFAKGGLLRVSVYLNGEYTSKEEFAAVCQAVLQGVQKTSIPMPQIGISTRYQGEANAFAMSFASAYQWDTDVAGLVPYIEMSKNVGEAGAPTYKVVTDLTTETIVD